MSYIGVIGHENRDGRLTITADTFTRPGWLRKFPSNPSEMNGPDTRPSSLVSFGWKSEDQ